MSLFIVYGRNECPKGWFSVNVNGTSVQRCCQSCPVGAKVVENCTANTTTRCKPCQVRNTKSSPIRKLDISAFFSPIIFLELFYVTSFSTQISRQKISFDSSRFFLFRKMIFQMFSLKTRISRKHIENETRYRALQIEQTEVGYVQIFRTNFIVIARCFFFLCDTRSYELIKDVIKLTNTFFFCTSLLPVTVSLQSISLTKINNNLESMQVFFWELVRHVSTVYYRHK